MKFIYKLILIVFQIININAYLKFWLYNIFFNYLNLIEIKIKINNILQKRNIVKICNKVFKKLSKYYFKIENKNEIIYNLNIILNFINKLKLYKI